MSKFQHTVKNLTEKYKEEQDDDALKRSLLKRAKGFVVEEITEEYSKENDAFGLKLAKRKVVTKEVPPDIEAIRALIELNAFSNDDNYKNMTDEQLETEKERLLKLLERDSEEER